MLFYTITIFLAFVAPTITAPANLSRSTAHHTPTRTVITTPSYINVGGALDTGAPREHEPSLIIKTPPPYMTINIVNRQGVALSTFPQSGTTSSTIPVPPPVSGNTSPGTIAAGATAGIAVPTDVS